jgi:hypothetical protein
MTAVGTTNSQKVEKTPIGTSIVHGDLTLIRIKGTRMNKTKALPLETNDLSGDSNNPSGFTVSEVRLFPSLPLKGLKTLDQNGELTQVEGAPNLGAVVVAEDWFVVNHPSLPVLRLPGGYYQVVLA